MLIWLSAFLAALVAAAAVVAWSYRKKGLRLEAIVESASLQLEQLQNSFARFAPQHVIEDIIARGLSTRAERRTVTVLFADLQGFTAMSENRDPEELVRILNGYFQRMSRAITDHRGHVSKFIGDGIMALFGAPEPNPWQTNDAVHAALAMREALEAYNRELETQSLPQLRIGIGLHRGPVVAGVLGSAELMEYTVIGDVVNTASRIEGLTRKHGCDILVSADTKAALDPRFVLEEKPAVEVKGKAEPVTTFAVLRFAEPAATA